MYLNSIQSKRTYVSCFAAALISHPLVAQTLRLENDHSTALEWVLTTEPQRTFFLLNSPDLGEWDYTREIVLGDGSEARGPVSSDTPKGFFRFASVVTNNPDFLDTDGDGQTDAYELANGTEPLTNVDGSRIYLEAEYPTTGQNYFTVTEAFEAGYSGDGHLVSFSNTTPGTYDGSSQDLASYDFSVSETGEYDVYFRVDHDQSGNNDSWFHRVDSGTWVTENGYAADGIPSFHWIASSTNPVSLTVGQIHTIEIANREDGLAMDKIAIFPTGSNAPTGAGSLAINMPNQPNYAAGSRIVASHYNSGGEVSSGASGTNIGFFDEGDSITFDNVDFTGIKTVVFEFTKGNTGGSGSLELRKGGVTGTLIATCSLGNTTGWSNYINWPVSITETTGVDSLTLVGASGEGIANIRSLHLSADFTPEIGEPVIGLHPGDLNGTITNGIAGYEDELGVNFDHILLFQSVYSLDFSVISGYLDDGYDVVLNLEFFEGEANLSNIVNGDYDAILDAFITEIDNDGRGNRISIRPLHEFNGNWYNWGVLYEVDKKGATMAQAITNFKAAWIYLIEKFKDPASGVPGLKFQLNYNFNTPSGYAPTTFEDFYPGDDYVDIVVVTCYNRSGTGSNPGSEPWKKFFENFENPYRQITSFTDLPIGIAETSSTSYNGNKEQWYIDAWTSMAFEYPRVKEINWFFENKDFASEPNTRDWDLNTEAQKATFKEGYDIFMNGR